MATVEKKWSELSRSVGTWAAENFGNTPVAKTFRLDVGGQRVLEHAVVELNWLAPLMGLVEELGEYVDAHEKPAGTELAVDAIADMGIYFSDYWHRIYGGRADVCLDSFCGAHNYWDPSAGVLTRRLGTLYHVHLKRFQMIRGMADDHAYEAALLEAQKGFFCALESLCETRYGKNLYDVTKGVFDEQVAKRNWKMNNKDGSSAASDN